MFFFSNFARVASKHDREALFGVFRVMKRKAAVSAILVMLLAVSTLSYAETGSIQITFVRAGRFIEGTGNLFYETNKYRFDISGLDTTLIRVRKLYLVGAALNLRAAEDIVGTYAAVDAGSAVVGYAMQARLQNANGVILEIEGVNLANKFTLDLTGMTITSREWTPQLDLHL